MVSTVCEKDDRFCRAWEHTSYIQFGSNRFEEKVGLGLIILKTDLALIALSVVITVVMIIMIVYIPCSILYPLLYCTIVHIIDTYTLYTGSLPRPQHCLIG